ncbi:hypothetical protein ACA910_003460 [Epithemia clementina (nom. ined.)]
MASASSRTSPSTAPSTMTTMQVPTRLMMQELHLEDELAMLGPPKPKRPLSAYNFFFQSERQKLLQSLPTRPEGKPRRSHGKCDFASMAKFIAKKWNEDDMEPQDRIHFEHLARQEKLRYKIQMAAYKNLVGPQKQKRSSSATSCAANASSSASSKTAPSAVATYSPDSQHVQPCSMSFPLPRPFAPRFPPPATSSLDSLASRVLFHPIPSPSSCTLSMPRSVSEEDCTAEPLRLQHNSSSASQYQGIDKLVNDLGSDGVNFFTDLFRDSSSHNLFFGAL